MRIKKEFEDKVVGFKGSRGKSLKELSPEQLERLAIIAKESNNKNLLRLFDGDLPSVKELKQRAIKAEKEKLPPPPSQSEVDLDPNKPVNA